MPILEAYKTGRGGFRLRAQWEKEDTGRGTYQIVVTEVPYQVQKAKLVERIAELISDKKLPLLGDVRDESAETVRLVLEPKSRSVDPVLLMESMFQSDRARGALLAEHERALRRTGARRAVAARRAETLAGAPPGGAGAALAVPPEEDRAPPGGARRLPDRLSQYRRGDPHRPLRGRSQGQADQALQAQRGAGRRHPQPAPQDRCRSWKRSRSRPSTTSSARSGASLKSLLKSRGRSSGSASPTRSRRRARPMPRRPSSAAARSSFADAPANRDRPRAGHDREGARSPSSCPRRAGSAP